MTPNDTIAGLAELAVGFGANVQPGQIVAIGSEPGKEALARAIAESAYAHGAKFVDVAVFDQHVKRSRLRHADRSTLTFVPSWYGERLRQLGGEHGALISLTGPVAPDLMEGIDPALLGLDLLPRLKESRELIEERLVNWTIVACPTPGWAEHVYPEQAPEEALERLWGDLAHICRLDEAEPAAAWRARLDELDRVASALDSLALDRLHFEGPGTDLTVGLLPSSVWAAAQFETIDGVLHTANIPTEEVFTAPDPERVDGHVTATKPLFVSGGLVTGLRVRFEGGRAVEIDADSGADTLRQLTSRDDGGERLGEVALVDRESRIGQLGTIFYDTLLDENAACHIALGQAYGVSVADDRDRERINRSEIHVDFMIGADDVAVTGVTADGTEVPLLRGGEWQV
jgi:aminopeptidase